MRSAPTLFALAVVFTVSPLGLTHGAPPSPQEDGKDARPDDRPKRNDARSTGVAAKRGRSGGGRRTPKRVITPGMRRLFPKDSPEKEIVVRLAALDDGYLSYHTDFTDFTDAQRAKIAAYRKVSVRKVARRIRHSIRVQLEDPADEIFLRRREGRLVRLRIKQDRKGKYVVRDVLPTKR